MGQLGAMGAGKGEDVIDSSDATTGEHGRSRREGPSAMVPVCRIALYISSFRKELSATESLRSGTCGMVLTGNERYL